MENIRKQAEESKVSISEICRRKLRTQSELNKLENILQEINKRINSIKYTSGG